MQSFRGATNAILFSAFVGITTLANAQPKNPKPDLIAELKSQIESLRAELKKTQDELTAQKNAVEQNQNTLLALEAQVAILQARLLAAQDQLAKPPVVTDPAIRAELDQLKSDNTSLQTRLASLEKSQNKDGLVFFGYLAANLRFLDLPDVTNADGTVDKKQDLDFFNNVVEIDAERRYKNRAKVRTDLLFNFTPANAAGAQGRAFQIDVEQAYAQLDWSSSTPKLAPTWTNPNTAPNADYAVIFGRFDAPWGFEPVNAPGNYCVTRSNLFQLIKPKLFTGALTVANWSEQVSTSLYVVNGLEDNFDVKNNFKTIGARVDLSAAPDGGVRPWSLALNGLAGSEQPTANNLSGDNGFLGIFPDPTLLFDIEYRLILGKLLIGGDALFGTIYDAQGGVDANQGSNPFFGLNTTIHYEINDRVGYTFRYDTVIDRQGALAGASGAVPLYPGRNQNTPVDANIGGTLHSLSADLNFTFVPNTPTLTFFEYRLDRFDPEDPAAISTSAQTITLQFIYSY
jgi:hypothetical protein